VEVRQANKALCPLHNEKTPSFTVYQNSNSWHCFGCGAGGSVIDFVMAYFGLNALDAAKKLDSDYNLGIFNTKISREELARISEQQAQNQVCNGLVSAFEAYMHKAYIFLCEYLHLLEDWKLRYAPKSPEETERIMNPDFVFACHQIGYISYLIDWLYQADFEEQIQFYKSHRKEMLEIAEKLKQYSKGRTANKSA
jgi:hypothetical protein